MFFTLFYIFIFEQSKAGWAPASGAIRNYCYYKEIAAEPDHDSRIFPLNSFRQQVIAEQSIYVCGWLKTSEQSAVLPGKYDGLQLELQQQC